MEGKKYWITVLLTFFCFVAVSQETTTKKIYNAFISGNMHNWASVLNKMENQQEEKLGYLLRLINYQYGYTGWCLGNDEKSEAKKNLSKLEKNLEKLRDKAGPTVNYHAYSAAAYGFKIGLKNWKAPFFGPKSMDHGKKALEMDSLSFQANVEMGNIWNHMPELFGGSVEKALKYYEKALEIYENREEQLAEKKWLYLNVIAISGQLEFEEGNYEKALQFYEKALNIEPKFTWLEKELLPQLKSKLN